jgi:hypothetical protein
MTMPFGLKNAGATYQRCMQACLKEQIGRNIEVYVDDIVIKTAKADSLLDDLRETFANLDRYSIKLNPKKCSFGVLLSPHFGQMRRWAVIKMGLENIYVMYCWIGLAREFGLNCPCICILLRFGLNKR